MEIYRICLKLSNIAHAEIFYIDEKLDSYVVHFRYEYESSDVVQFGMLTYDQLMDKMFRYWANHYDIRNFKFVPRDLIDLEDVFDQFVDTNGTLDDLWKFVDEYFTDEKEF